MRKPAYLLICLILSLYSCKKDDGPGTPEGVRLIFPENNSECIDGIVISQNSSEVLFQWQPADNASNYELAVSRIGSNIVERLLTANTSASVVLDRGAPYSWSVTARNASGTEGPASDTWQFYNAGSVLSYPPFPATILAPASGSSVVANSSGQITLEWGGADVDGDLAGYEIFFGTDAGNLQRIASPGSAQSSLDVDVSSGAIYFWEVLSIDSEGNTSRSGIYSFRIF